MPPSPLFALVDCNNFYVSCERIFQPKLNGKPVIVLSNNDGCVVSRSNEAKKLGIKMGQPVFEVRDLIEKNKVKEFSANFALYGDMSSRIMKLLATFVPDIEIYSIDECFLDFSSVDPERAHRFATQIRQQILLATGIPVSIGIGPTKTLAKAGSELAKSNPETKGVVELSDPEVIESALKQLPVGEIWGIGRGYARRMEELHVATAYDFTRLSPILVQKEMTIGGLRIWHELQRTPCIDLATDTQGTKQVISSRTFGKKVYDLVDLEEAVSSYAAVAGTKLRERGICARYATVYIRTSAGKDRENYYANSETVTLTEATDYTPTIIAAALSGLRKIFRTGHGYKKAGIVLSGMTTRDELQTSIFGPDTSSAIKHSQLMKVLDRLKTEHGEKTVRLASEGLIQNWRGKSAKRSPRYTTEWDELPIVK